MTFPMHANATQLFVVFISVATFSFFLLYPNTHLEFFSPPLEFYDLHAFVDIVGREGFRH